VKVFGSLSLSRRLMATLIAASVGYWAVVVVVMITHSVDETYELFDSNLAQTALALLRVTDPDDSEPVGLPVANDSPAVADILGRWPDLGDRLSKLRSRPGAVANAAPDDADHVQKLYREYERRLRYQIWNSQGDLLVKSSNAPSAPMVSRDGFSELIDGDGVVWRYYGVWDRHRTYRVLVAEAHDVRNSLLRNIAMDLVRPMVFGLPVLMFLLLFAIRRGLRPLRLLAADLAKKKVADLAPLDVGKSPNEIRPMVLALNNLLDGVERALENERCFTANAAHELRTPLAAIQAHLAAARFAESDAEREQSFDQLQRSLDRGIRLLGQLLTLARLDPEHSLPDVQLLDMGELLASVCAELTPTALRRTQTVELAVPPDLPRVPGNAGLLSMLFANLIDNAIRYTPDGGHISVNAHHQHGCVMVEVIDDGPGIPVEQRARVFERFCRLADQSKPGTGLGLTICRRVAQLHGAQIELSGGSAGGGLTVRVSLRDAETVQPEAP
jgi:two-component system, OmpR family, sensor histidine kinase QseC